MFWKKKQEGTLSLRQENEDRYIITESKKVACYKLLQGAKPSELGLDFNESADLLTSFELMLKDQLQFMESSKENNPQKRETLIDIMNKAIELRQFFAEAARLTGENG